MKYLLNLSSKNRKRYIEMVEHMIMLDICTKMVDENRRLTSDEIQNIVHKNLKIIREQV